MVFILLFSVFFQCCFFHTIVVRRYRQIIIEVQQFNYLKGNENYFFALAGLLGGVTAT